MERKRRSIIHGAMALFATMASVSAFDATFAQVNSPVGIGAKLTTPIKAPTAAQDWTTAYARRVYRLGTTLSDFKKTPYPDQSGWPGAVAACDDGPTTSGAILDSNPWKRIGVVECSFFYRQNDTDPFVQPAGLLLGDVSPATNNFYFYPPKDGAEPVLFLIDTEGYGGWFDQTVAAFRAQQGEPSSVETVPMQNGFGAAFFNTVVTYHNSCSQIVLSRYGDDLNTFRVRYVLNLIGDRVEKAAAVGSAAPL